MSQHVVLAYSGGLDASVALTWLRETRGLDVVTLTLDLGQGADLEEIRARALLLGATRGHVLDVRDDFARQCVLPALQSRLFHDATVPISRIAHPLIARKLVEVAAIEQASIVAHGGGPRDHASIQAAVHALNPRIEVIAAVPESGLAADGLVTFARTHGLAVAPGSRPRTRTARAIETPAHVDVRFEEGVPVSVNDVPMPLVELIDSVATIASHHGIGRSAEPAPGSFDAPAAVVLSDAYDALIRGVDSCATGVVRMRLFKGEHSVVGHSPVAVQ